MTATFIRRYLAHFKKIIRDKSVFEDNQMDPEALETCLTSVAPSSEDTPAQEVEAGDDDEVRIFASVGMCDPNGVTAN